MHWNSVSNFIVPNEQYGSINLWAFDVVRMQKCFDHSKTWLRNGLWYELSKCTNYKLTNTCLLLIYRFVWHTKHPIEKKYIHARTSQTQKTLTLRERKNSHRNYASDCACTPKFRLNWKQISAFCQKRMESNGNIFRIVLNIFF